MLKSIIHVDEDRSECGDLDYTPTHFPPHPSPSPAPRSTHDTVIKKVQYIAQMWGVPTYKYAELTADAGFDVALGELQEHLMIDDMVADRLILEYATDDKPDVKCLLDGPESWRLLLARISTRESQLQAYRSKERFPPQSLRNHMPIHLFVSDPQAVGPVSLEFD